jgi:hypothetical protein
MQVFQGLWIVLAGALAARIIAPGTAIAISGGVGAALAVVLATVWAKALRAPSVS